MICSRCNGKGRIVTRVGFGQGDTPPIEVDEIGICPVCLGTKVELTSAQEERAESILASLPCECNPNEAS